MAKRRNQHVVPKDGNWAVRGSGSSRATRVYKTQRDAITVAREIARNQKSELIIHGRDGRIREKNSYGNDPFPPRDKN
jgi:hypothetical protein